VPVQIREALQTLQRFWTDRFAGPPNVDQFSPLPILTIPVDRTFDQVQPGVFTSAALAAAPGIFTWPPVPDDEAHVYENLSFTQDGVAGQDIVVQVIGRQVTTSWSRVYAEWDGIQAGERVDLLAGYNDGGGGTPSWNSGGPLRIYSGEQLRVRSLGNFTLNAIVRFDWIRRIRQSPFTFVLRNDAVVVT